MTQKFKNLLCANEKFCLNNNNISANNISKGGEVEEEGTYIASKYQKIFVQFSQRKMKLRYPPLKLRMCYSHGVGSF